MIDAHCHLQFPVLATQEDELIPKIRDAGIRYAIVNGTCESDWSAVAELCSAHAPMLRPAYGLHPWNVMQRTECWRNRLEECLRNEVQATIGECGLDFFRTDICRSLQREIFCAHVELSCRWDRPLTIHGVKAWSAVYEILHDIPALPPFLLHSFRGSKEQIPAFAKLGAYFSFSASFLHANNERIMDVYRAIPIDRLLVETDAPEMRGPEYLHPEFATFPYHSPLTLPRTIEHLAGHLGLSNEECVSITTGNAMRLFRIEGAAVDD